jgi:hypothetical protein
LYGYEDISRYSTTTTTNLLNENKYSVNLCDRKGNNFLSGAHFSRAVEDFFLLTHFCVLFFRASFLKDVLIEKTDTKTCAMTMGERSETTVLLSGELV